MTLFLTFGVPIIGYEISLIAMRFYKLTKKDMVDVQKRIAAKKQALQSK